MSTPATMQRTKKADLHTSNNHPFTGIHISLFDSSVVLWQLCICCCCAHCKVLCNMFAHICVVFFIFTKPTTHPMPSFVKLYGDPLSFRIANDGLGLCHTQSVKLIHPRRLQSALYIQNYVTTGEC